MTAVTRSRLHHILHEDTRWFMLYLKLNSHKICRIKPHQKSHQQTPSSITLPRRRPPPPRAGTAVGVQPSFNCEPGVDTVGVERQPWCLLQTHMSWGCPRRSVGSRTESQLHWQAYARRPLLLLSLALSFCRSGELFLLRDRWWISADIYIKHPQFFCRSQNKMVICIKYL